MVSRGDSIHGNPVLRCSLTRDLHDGIGCRRFAQIERVAMRKLAMLHAAGTLADLRIPPGNRLEPLRGERYGQYSIRINDQFRVCFLWTKTAPAEVEIVDYH